MDYVLEAAQTLQKAEATLRGLVAKAAGGGDYANVMQIASWAQAIKELLVRDPSTVDEGAENDGNVPGTRHARIRLPHARNKLNQAKQAYPRFFRRGDQLVRVAWSKRDRSEYQHKTSQSVLKKLAASLLDLGGNGRVFSTDDVLPLQDDNGGAVPAYQVYVCIALLKQAGVLDQHGRQGYSLACGKDLAKAVEAIWKKLPER